jgi:hypothetical protein
MGGGWNDAGGPRGQCRGGVRGAAAREGDAADRPLPDPERRDDRGIDRPRRPGAEYPAVALALDARMEVVSPKKRRSIAAADLFEGRSTTSMEPTADEQARPRASSVRQRAASPARGRDPGAHHRRGSRVAPCLRGLELARADGPRRRRTGPGERADDLPALRERAGAARRRAGPSPGAHARGVAGRDRPDPRVPPSRSSRALRAIGPSPQPASASERRSSQRWPR